MPTDRGLLLDTHIWIWLNNCSPELSPSTIQAIDKAACSGQVYIPAICVWELATITLRGRVTLRSHIKHWVAEALSMPGVELVPLSPDIAIESTLLPGDFHSDPADRIIVATARVQRLTLVTRDKKILQYSKRGYLEIFAA